MRLLDKYNSLDSVIASKFRLWINTRYWLWEKLIPIEQQIEVISDYSKSVLWATNRRQGKTVVCLLKALYSAYSKPNQNIAIFATNETKYLMFIMLEEMKECSKDTYEKCSYLYKFNNGSVITINTVDDVIKHKELKELDLIVFDDVFDIDPMIVKSIRQNRLKPSGKEFMTGRPGASIPENIFIKDMKIHTSCFNRRQFMWHYQQ